MNDVSPSDVVPVTGTESVETPTKEPRLTRLCMFEADEHIALKLARTAEYVNDPRQYLVRTIGEETIKARGDTLCI